MSIKRKDTKGRILRDGEIQKADGRYEFRYNDAGGVRRSLYSWKLTDSDPIPDGKRKCESLRSLEKKALRDLEDGIRNTSDTLDDRFKNYILNKPELKGSTRAHYSYMYRKYVQTAIGGLRICSISYSTIRKLFNSFIFELGLKSSTIKEIYSILHPVFTVASRDGLIRTNPTEGILDEMRRSNGWVRSKRHGLTEEQQKAFLNYLDENYIFSHWKPLFVCLLGTGCRIGEMLGLRWENVDWEENVITIDHALVYRLQENGKVEFDVTSPKTSSGIRQIPMFQSVRKALMEERLKGSKCEFIFANRYGKPLTSYDVNRAIDRILERYRLEGRQPLIPKFTAHQLRHTFCTRLCERETDLKLIQEIMGHSDISTTMNIYNESSIERKKASFARIESTTDFTTNNC